MTLPVPQGVVTSVPAAIALLSMVQRAHRWHLDRLSSVRSRETEDLAFVVVAIMTHSLNVCRDGSHAS